MKTKFKTLFALAALLLASATSASAQQTSTEGKNYPHIFLGLQGGAEMTLFSADGRTLRTERGTGTMSVAGMNGGVYLLSVETADGTAKTFRVQLK